MGTLPKRRKGTEKVTTLGVTSRMTSTSSGFGGMSLDDIISLLLSLLLNTAAEVPKRVMPAMSFRFDGGLRRCWGCEDVLMALGLGVASMGTGSW